MSRFFKTVICLFLAVSLIFSCSCNFKEDTPHDSEAQINKGSTVTAPEIVTDESINAAKGSEAQLTEEEKKHIWSYYHLDETEQRLYRIILNMARDLTVGFIDMGYLGKNAAVNVARAYRAVFNDFPEYYWMPVSYYLNVDKETKASLAFKKNDIEDGYGFTKEQIRDNAEEFYDSINRIIEKTESAESDFEKELIIHDALCKTVTYDSDFDFDGKNNIYTAYGALVNGRAVCEGYARAFKLLCRYADIKCILITGDSRGVGHMWNMVELDSQWYHVDVTWDDLRKEPLHTYLNLTERSIRADHDIDISYNKADPNLISQGNSFNFYLPKAESTEYNYYIQKGLIIDSDPVSPLVDELISAYNNGLHKAEFLFVSEELQKDFKENYESYVVSIQEKCVEQMGAVYFKLSTISFPSETCVIYFEEYEKEKSSLWSYILDYLKFDK